MYKVLIVDDEFLARKLLQGYVSKLPELELIGAAQNAFEAFTFQKEQPADILLLDIHMPDLNGLELARMLKGVPAIIFTTAYSEYALESYEVSAVDYLLKPIALPRFMQAIEKAQLQIDALRMKLGNLETDAPVFVAEQPAAEPAAAEPVEPAVSAQSAVVVQDFLMVKADYRLYKVNFSDLLYIEGQHEYVSFYTTRKRITALYSLKSLEEQLPQNLFIRVHKSYIISIANIQEIDQNYVSVAGQKVPIGGSYRDALMRKLGQ